MKILFIAYYFDPYPGVGAKRVSYWVKHIYERSNYSIEPTIITATKPDKKVLKEYKNLIYIKDTGQSIYKYLFKYDPGITWINNLQDYFKVNSSKFKYDVVLLTGGPFLHFGISRFLKKKFNSKIILDYRDPFAINPLFRNQNFLKLFIKKKLEKKFNKLADKIITVNKYCAKLLINDNPNKIEIIDNGFDETVIDNINTENYKIRISNKKYIDIVYAGKLSHGRNIEPFLKFIINQSILRLHYIGSDSKLLEKYSFSKNIIIYGEKSYNDTLKIISECDIGLVLTGGHPFESTTKIFDYIGLKKTILIITNGKKYFGSIYDILKNYPSQIWCENNEDDFKYIYSKYKSHSFKMDKFDTSIYSRKYGLEKLIKILKNLK
jgi:hypothetical protein